MGMFGRQHNPLEPLTFAACAGRLHGRDLTGGTEVEDTATQAVASIGFGLMPKSFNDAIEK